MINVDDWLIDIENEQITQNNQLTTIENEQITQNNTLINHNNWITTLELHEYPESLANLADVTMNYPLTIGQVFAYGGGGWGNYTIDISTQQPIIDLDNWITTLEQHEYPESLRNLADVDDTNIGDGWLISYDIISDMFVMIDPPNTFPEAPNTNTAYIWKTVAGDG